MKEFTARFALKVAGTLTAIALAVAALLGAVNHITADPIAARLAESTRVALSAVAPAGTDFTPLELSEEAVAAAAQGGTLKELYAMSVGGYAVKVVTSGSQGNIEMIVGVDETGAITGVSIVDNAETAGIGSKVMENLPNEAGTPVLDQFIGMSGAGTLVVKKNIIPVTGATVSTRGVTAGANAALAVAELLG